MEQHNDNSMRRLAYYLLAIAAAIAAIYIVIYFAGGNKSSDIAQPVCEQDSTTSVISTKALSTESDKQPTTPDAIAKEPDTTKKELNNEELDVDKVKKNALEAIEEAQKALKETKEDNPGSKTTK